MKFLDVNEKTLSRIGDTEMKLSQALAKIAPKMGVYYYKGETRYEIIDLD